MALTAKKLHGLHSKGPDSTRVVIINRRYGTDDMGDLARGEGRNAVEYRHYE